MANNWLPITPDDAVERAKTDASAGGVDYELGKGGYSCTQSHCYDSNRQCDCSGAVAYWLGTDRQTNAIPGGWIETSMCYSDATSTRKLFEKIGDAEPGCILVYGDSGGSEGHIGLATAVSNGTPTYVAHCTARGGLPSAVVNEPYSVFWQGAVANRGAIFARYKRFGEGEPDVTKTTVYCNGAKGRGYFDEGSNFPDLALIKAWMVERGAVFTWDGAKDVLTITLPECDTETATAAVAAPMSAPTPTRSRRFTLTIEE